jgi:hypothetical protein
MTLGGSAPYGPGGELPQGAPYTPGQFPVPPSGPAGPWPQHPVPRPLAKGGGLIKAGVAAALAMATAALVVGGIALTRDSGTTAESSSGIATVESSAADKALCEAVAPAMVDSEKITNTFIRLGAPGSPERDSALPKFVGDTKEWVKTAQNAIDSHPDAGGYLRRSLQQYIDDYQTLVLSMKPGQLQPYQEQLYQATNATYDGPVAICENLGVKW